MHNTDSLSRAIHAARAGQSTLARFHCQQAAEIQSDDPLVWLWLAWLSDSPSSMYQCLQVAQKDPRYSEVVEAGIVFARALCGATTSCDGSTGENSNPSDVAAYPLRIGDTHAVEEDSAAIVALPETPVSVADDTPPTSQLESAEVSTATEPVLDTEPEQQCVETLNELSAEVNGEEQSELAADAQAGDTNTPMHPNADLFTVAQAMLGDSPDDQGENADALVAGVSVTNDPWMARNDDDASAIDNTGIQEAPTAVENAVASPVEDAMPAWVKNLSSCDDQSAWSAQDNEFIPVVENEAGAAEGDGPENSSEENQTSAATRHQSNFVNATQGCSVDIGAEQDGCTDNKQAIPTVLVVDDSPAVRKLVQLTLRGRGYNIVTAFDGVAAIKEIAQHEPCLILLDINMPRLDGYQLCSLIRKHERTQHIPVVMFSDKDGVFDQIRGTTIGCTSYIEKPFAPEALIEEVEKHIGEHTEVAR